MKKQKLLSGGNVVLGVCSSIAAYKACDIVSALVKAGANVEVIMTENACKLISPRIFQTLSRNQVHTSMWAPVADWKPEHISLAERADVFAVAPATANAIGNFANGIAGDFLSTAYLATTAPVVIAPAMNAKMYAHPAVARNLGILRRDGAEIIEPETGLLACGAEGRGRLAPAEKIAGRIIEILRG